MSNLLPELPSLPEPAMFITTGMLAYDDDAMHAYASEYARTVQEAERANFKRRLLSGDLCVELEAERAKLFVRVDAHPPVQPTEPVAMRKLGKRELVSAEDMQAYAQEQAARHAHPPVQPTEPNSWNAKAYELLCRAGDVMGGLDNDDDLEDELQEFVKLAPPVQPTEPVALSVIRKWPEGFEARLQAVWVDVIGFIPTVKLYDLQRVLAEFGFRMEVYEDAAHPLVQPTEPVPECTHELWEREAACADGYCPICMAAVLAHPPVAPWITPADIRGLKR